MVENSFFTLSKTNVMAEFRILGDEFDLDAITKRLSIEPSEYWKKGEPVKNRGIYRQYTCWALSTGYMESLDINDQLGLLLNKLVDKCDDLIEIKKLFSVNYKIDIIINIEDNQTPAIYLKSNSINFAHLISAEFDFDLYVYS